MSQRQGNRTRFRIWPENRFFQKKKQIYIYIYIDLRRTTSVKYCLKHVFFYFFQKYGTQTPAAGEATFAFFNFLSSTLTADI